MRFLNDLSADLRFTARLFRANLGFSAVAIGSLALGIGASSAIFSLIYAVLIDPYPYKHSERMVATTFVDRQGRDGRMEYTIPDFLDYTAHAHTIEDAFLFARRDYVITTGLPEKVAAELYSPNGFDFMGVPAIMGRTFTPRDIPAPAAPPNLVVLSYLFWQRHFNADLSVINKKIELNHKLFTVAGVLPSRFTWNDADLYVPLPMLVSREQWEMMARIKPGVSLQAAGSELQAFTERFARCGPHLYPPEFRMELQRLNDWLLGKFQGTLLILLAAVGFLLLIACSNVWILLLARAGERRKEIAVRISLGAAKGRVMRQLLTESVSLAFVGGVLGVVLAYGGVPAIVKLMPEYSVPHEAVIHVNAMVVLFTFLISVISGILFGIAPALQLARPDLRDDMQGSSRSSTGGLAAGKTRNALIVGEVALTVILLVGAGVAIRGFISLLHVPLGYDSQNVLALFVSIQKGSYETWPTRGIFFDRVLNAFQQTPGVETVAVNISALPPFIGFGTKLELPGRPANGSRQTLVGLVGSEYFRAIHVPLLAGRTFTADEDQRADQLAVINEEMRRQYFRDRDPIGLKVVLPEMNFGDNPDLKTPPNRNQTMEIIGVVANVPNRGLQEHPKPALYLPYRLVLPPGCGYLVRTRGDPRQVLNTLRAELLRLDPDQPISDAFTLDEILDREAHAYPRFSTTLFSIFGAVALLLATAGIFSVVSYVVARRTREFGIRMALGARPADVLTLVAGMTARLMLVGIGIGLAGSLALSRVIANYVQGWDPKDPVAFLSVVAVLVGAAMAACLLPAQRAVSIQPMAALRHE